MSALDAALSDLSHCLADVDALFKLKKSASGVKDVLAFRTKVVTKVGEIWLLAAEDAKLQDDPDVARDFTDRLQSVRRALAPVQAKWRAVNVEEDYESYRREAGAAVRVMSEFVEWARAHR